MLRNLQMDKVAHSHKIRVSMNERNGRRGYQREEADLSSPTPVLMLTHVSHIATRPPGCLHKELDYQVFGFLLNSNQHFILNKKSI